MRLIYRPSRGSLVGGVAAGIAERYGIGVNTLRLLIVAIFAVSQLGILFYILLWLSTPSEQSVLPRLRLASDLHDTHARFDQFALLASTGLRGSSESIVSSLRIAIAVMMIVVATVLQTSHPGGISIGFLNPLYASQSFIGIRLGVALLYFSLAYLFLTPTAPSKAALVLQGPRKSRFEFDHSETRALLGVVSGFASLTGLETSFLRVVLVMFNFLTLGIAGLLYLIVGVVLQRRENAKAVPEENAGVVLSEARVSPVQHLGLQSHLRLHRIASLGIGGLWVVLLVMRLTTEFRFYFFNESFWSGTVYAVIATVFSYLGLKHGNSSDRAKLWLILGSMFLLEGIFRLSASLYNVQLTQILSFQLVFILSGICLIYFALALLEVTSRNITLMVGLVFLLCAIIIRWQPESIHFFFSLTQFYAFFYPLLFAACGLWLLVGRGRRSPLFPGY